MRGVAYRGGGVGGGRAGGVGVFHWREPPVPDPDDAPCRAITSPPSEMGRR